MEGRYVGNIGKKRQSAVEKEAGTHKSVSCNVYLETQGGNFEYFLKSSGGWKSESRFKKACVQVKSLFFNSYLRSPSVGLAVHFLLAL